MTVRRADTEDDLLTLDELSERVGMSVRTIRFYGGRGLIPPSIRRGRAALYTAGHVARLEVVKALQEHGFTLSAIEGYLSRIPADATPEEVGLQRVMLQPWLVEAPVPMSAAELARAAGRPLDEGAVDALRVLRVVRDDGRGGFEVSMNELPAALRIADLGVPPDILDESRTIYETHARAMAEELGDLLRHRLWPYFREGGLSAAQMLELFETLKPVSVAALVQAYTEAMDEARREQAERRAR